MGGVNYFKILWGVPVFQTILPYSTPTLPTRSSCPDLWQELQTLPVGPEEINTLFYARSRLGVNQAAFYCWGAGCPSAGRWVTFRSGGRSRKENGTLQIFKNPIFGQTEIAEFYHGVTRSPQVLFLAPKAKISGGILGLIHRLSQKGPRATAPWFPFHY